MRRGPDTGTALHAPLRTKQEVVSARRAFEEKARASYNGVNSFTNWVLAIARNMVMRYGMSNELGHVVYERDNRTFLSGPSPVELTPRRLAMLKRFSMPG